MLKYKEKFITHFRIKDLPSDFEMVLFRKTKTYLQCISRIPGIKMVWVCNSLSMYCTKPTSDIDLFIITAKNRVWFVRFFSTLILYILWVWRKDETNSAWNFCLSFFVDENNLDFSKISIENDIYLFYWIFYLKPVINYDKTYEKFIEENKNLGIFWADLPKDSMDYVLFDRKERLHRSETESGSGTMQPESGTMQSFLTKLYDFIDFLWYFLYTKIYKKNSRKAKNIQNPAWVIISREMLKFHDNDKREEIRDKIL